MDAMLDKKAMCDEIKELLDYLHITFKNRMVCTISRDTNGLFSEIKMIPIESVYDYVPSTTTSILKKPEGSIKNSYEARMLKEIQKLQEEEMWVSQIFFYICQLPYREKHYVIATYFADETKENVMNELGIKERTYSQIKTSALYHLALFIPGGMKIKEEKY